MVAAWLPAGIAAGVVLSATTRMNEPARLGLLGTLTAVLLVGSGAVADAAAISDSVGKHIAPQLGRSGLGRRSCLWWSELPLLPAWSALAACGKSISARIRHRPESGIKRQ